MADPDQRRAEIAHEAAHLGQDLRLDRHVERGRRLVARRSAPAGAAARSRWRRAGACRRRTGADRRRAAAPRRECATRGQRRDRARARALASTRAHAPRSARRICVAMVSTGLSDAHRVLEHHRDALAAQARAAALAASPTSSCPSSLTEPRDDPAGRIDQAEDREAGDALARAGFADQPEHLAARQRRTRRRRPPSRRRRA